MEKTKEDIHMDFLVDTLCISNYIPYPYPFWLNEQEQLELFTPYLLYQRQNFDKQSRGSKKVQMIASLRHALEYKIFVNKLRTVYKYAPTIPMDSLFRIRLRNESRRGGVPQAGSWQHSPKMILMEDHLGELLVLFDLITMAKNLLDSYNSMFPSYRSGATPRDCRRSLLCSFFDSKIYFGLLFPKFILKSSPSWAVAFLRSYASLFVC